MAERMTRKESWAYFEHTLTNAVLAEKGKIACIDTSTGLITKAGVSTTLRPIGYFDKTMTGDAGGSKVRIRLFADITLHRFNNDGTNPVATPTHIGGLCYLIDDQTVSSLSTSRSAAGRVWLVSSGGVLVQVGAP